MGSGKTLSVSATQTGFISTTSATAAVMVSFVVVLVDIVAKEAWNFRASAPSLSDVFSTGTHSPYGSRTSPS